MTDDQIKHMVDRFLSWRLPENFHPDAGISFQPEYNVTFNAVNGKPPSRHEPAGTNLFTATQADAMVRHMLEGMPADGDCLPCDCSKRNGLLFEIRAALRSLEVGALGYGETDTAKWPIRDELIERIQDVLCGEEAKP